jgi:hypothetical protein
MARFFNNRSSSPPRLRVYLNLDNRVDLPCESIWPRLTGRARDFYFSRELP